jgi:hypothetical protein
VIFLFGFPVLIREIPLNQVKKTARFLSGAKE